MAWLGVVEMVELITLHRTTVQQALEALENLYLTLPPETVLAKSLDRRIMNLKAALEQPEQPNPWRDAVDHELLTLHMVASDDPQESIRRLIDWHCAVQIDPLVSSAAQELIERGKREALEQPEPDAIEQALAHAEAFSRGHDAGWQSAIAHRAELAEPEQEPVARFDERYGGPVLLASAPMLCDGQLLYTHPPRREVEQPEQEPELRKLLISAAAMAVAAERKGAYQGASWVADAVLEQPVQEPVEIKPPNQEGSSTCTVRWTIETPAGWIGAWDKEALEQFSYVFRKPVAWRYKSKESMPWSLSEDSFYISCKRDKGYIVEPLYNLLLDGRS
jgi:hypothetical protein